MKVDGVQLTALCDIIGATDNNLMSKSFLKRKLSDAGIPVLDDGARQNGHSYVFGQNKRDWLYNCLAAELNRTKRFDCLVSFLEVIFNPVSYTQADDRAKYESVRAKLNKALMLCGYEITQAGRVERIVKAQTLDEVDRRLDALNCELNRRGVDQRVRYYSRIDIERRDYGSAVLESVKALVHRVQEMTGLSCDGRKLFEQAFSPENAYLHINKGETRSEKDEQRGLQDFFCALLGLIRNPMSHTLKLDWDIDERRSVDLLILASVAHQYLDRCYLDPQKCSKR